MDRHTANSLIADSGIHFKTVEREFNADEPLVLDSGRTLKYTFLETIDFLNDSRVRVDLCGSLGGEYVPHAYIMDNDLAAVTPNGIVIVDETGVTKIKKDTAMSMVEKYASDAPELMNVNSLSSYRINNGGETKTAFELLLGKWLPMPMFEKEISGHTSNYPTGWCRVRIDAISERDRKGMQRFRFTWAFDTKLACDDAEGLLRPSFLDGGVESKKYCLCNKADLLLGNFLNIPDGENDTPVSDYIVSLLGLDMSQNTDHKYRFIAFYTYLVNYLRLSGAAPEVTLYHNTERRIPVDMSVDIGNSRTCAMLFEEGDFTKARELVLTDLSEPWRTYEKSFDMRMVFRRADFGGDITINKELFLWPSLVRVGEEAQHLVYRSMENNGESERTTNYSSPKRYLWDDKPFENRWEQLVINGDPTNLIINPEIYLEGFTDHFDTDGSFLVTPKVFDLFSMDSNDNQCHYSRSSLMTFVMIEMMQQALCFINSCKFRYMHGNIDCSRHLRNIIVTCPTAMPLAEQFTLRKAAKDASHLLRIYNPSLPEITITPDPDLLKPTNNITAMVKRGWLYDEAFASQLVYLYSQLSECYKGKVDDFFNLKGHKRKEIENMGFNGNALTIGTVDIGAGTTDVMITAFGQKGMGRLTPVPLFYDSFYTAGDDILHNIIRDIILEGPRDGAENMGSIDNALAARIKRMTPDELLTIPRIADSKEYRQRVEDIRYAMTEEDKAKKKSHLVHELMHNFFAEDSAHMSEKDRRCRLDFCTQVSHPMSQFFLELLKQERPSRVYTFDELFPKERPAQFLLDHFAYNFGFRFESLSWRYDPEQVGRIVTDTMETIVKALSVVLFAYNCDIVVLSGRPTNLKPLTELFVKYVPVSPSRMVLLNRYRVGRWFPQSTEEGYFKETQKAVVAVGAEVGYLASTTGFNGLVLDFSTMSRTMKSTARYIGFYDENMQEVRTPFLSPDNATANLKGVSVFPCYIGCKQFDSPKYQARPLYAIYNNSSSPQLNIMLQRNYHDDRELLSLEDVTNMEGDTVSNKDVRLQLQTMTHDGLFWMDRGAFVLKIQEL